MAEMTPQQQNLLRYLVPLLQAKESAQAAVGPSALGTVLDMILPSSQTVEKMSYGDMPFRMPTQSRIPITTDKQYLADLIGVAGALTPAAKPVQRGVQQLVREIQTTAPMGQFRLSTPSKPDPEVGTRFQREYIGGLAEKTPVKIEDVKGSSVSILPWDSSSRNYRISSISEETLPTPVVTHGGQDYARDLAHMEQGVAGASNLDIAKRIRSRDAQARAENLAAGGTGDVIHMPVTMGEGAENFSVMPTEILLQMLDRAEPSKKFVKELDNAIREFPLVKGTGEKRKVTYPFKKFKGVMTEEGRMQLYTGEGVDSTAGELRKALVNRATLKENQKYLGFNVEDLAASIIDPSLAGVQKGMIGNTLIRVGEEGMHLRPSQNPTYSTDFTGQYLGTLGQTVPVEVLFPRLFPKLTEEFAGKKGDIRNMALGALEKRKEGFSEIIDQQVIDNYYNYLNQQRNLGLLD